MQKARRPLKIYSSLEMKAFNAEARRMVKRKNREFCLLSPGSPTARTDSRGTNPMSWTHDAKLLPVIRAAADEIVALRRDLHAHPELGFETKRTTDLIVKTLRGWGVEEVHDDWTRGGVVAVIEGNRPGRTVAIRADIDALAMPDESGAPWASPVCRSHACGHDGHAAWMLGAVKALHEDRNFPGRVAAIFQPAEEIGRGAKSVVDSGVLERLEVAEIYGAHNDSTLPEGVFGFREGAIQASCDFFHIRLVGRGIHAARPHYGIDPVTTGALLVSALQNIVARKIDPLESAVVSVSAFEAGDCGAPNVMPGEARLAGTVRTFSESVRDRIEEEMRRMVEEVAASQGCRAEFRYDRLTSVVMNDGERTAAIRRVAAEHFGEDAIGSIVVSMSGEDFSEYLRRIPGAMFRVGFHAPGHEVPLHNPKFDFNDAIIPAAATLFVLIAKARLEALAAATK